MGTLTTPGMPMRRTGTRGKRLGNRNPFALGRKAVITTGTARKPTPEQDDGGIPQPAD
jgi:hypothetical protein